MQDINALLEQLRALLGRQPTPTGGSAESEIATQMGELAGRRPGDRSAYDVANKATAQFLPNVGYSPGVTPRPTMDNSPGSIAAGEEFARLNKPNTGWAQDTLNAGAARDALAQSGARPTMSPILPPNVISKPMPLNPDSVTGLVSDFAKQNLPSRGDPGAFVGTMQDRLMGERPTSPRIPKAGGGRNLQRVSPGVYRNQKGGLVQRKTGGR